MAEKSISALSPNFFPHFTEMDSTGHFCVPWSCCKSRGKESHLEDFAPSQLHTASGAYLALLHLQVSPWFPQGCAALLPPLLSLSAKKRNIPSQAPEGKQRNHPWGCLWGVQGKWLVPLPLLLTWTLPALPRPAPSWLTWDPSLHPKQLVLCYRPFLSSHSPGDTVCPLGCCWLLSLQPAHEGTEPSEQWANQPGKGTSWKSKRSFLQTLSMIPANHSAEGKYSCIWRALVQRGQEWKHRTNFTIECYLYVPQLGE